MEERYYPKILVVEDDENIRKFVTINLERSEFEVYEASNGQEAYQLVHDKNPDLVVLDLMLPDIDGYEICQTLRNKDAHLAIILLTAKSQDMDKVIGLELGADDYMVKPFNPMELVARIRSVLRRTSREVASTQKNVIAHGSLKLDIKSNLLYKNNNRIDLTPKEYKLIKWFMENPGQAFSRDELLDVVWDYEFFGEPKTVDVHIRRLREKIEDQPSNPEFIETVWGFGYRWKG